MWLRNADIEVFLPRIRMLGRTRPLFPSYLFVQSDLLNPCCYQLIRYTRGVSQILGNGREPVPASEKAIHFIRSRIGAMEVIEPKYCLRLGQELRVRKGPFKDLIGIMERMSSDQERVHVLLNLMQRQIRVELPLQQLASV